MSEETLEKIKLAFLHKPGLEKSVQDIGEELVAKGVLQNMQQGMGKQDLGELSANVQQQKGEGRGKDSGQGRG